MLFKPRPKGLGKENFLKLNDNEEISGVFRGEIHTFKRHWVNQRSVECPGDDTCPICNVDPDNYPSFRFRINFITTKNGEWIAKIFEGGGELYDMLVTIDRKFDLSRTAVEITRMGLKQNTKYSVLPRLDMPITEAMEEKLSSVSLLPLTAAIPEAA